MSKQIDITKIKAGDEVQWLGGWRKVVQLDGHRPNDLHVEHVTGVWIPLEGCFITAHRPAQPEQPHEWLTEEEWMPGGKEEYSHTWRLALKDLKEKLTTKYPHGPLIVKTATGDGEGRHDVFWLDQRIRCLECDLEPGDRYIELPDLSKEGES